ncbi:MAG: hypothetical protein GY940_31650 [bacterium]|nr:hypothetical protein [bacterium]
MDTQKDYIEKIESLVYSASKFNEMSFRMVLEGLVNKGGEEAEYQLVHYIGSRDLDLETRINIIRVVGYIQGTHFLVPLKKIIDTEENIHIKKEALISVSKYNDRRALNILNHTLSNIKNPLLLETINNEIAKIKKHNPLFGLLPRFLEGEKNLKNFSVTLGILKRILSPVDAVAFVNYLNCGKELIENGAFEVLCFTADADQVKAIFDFFQDRFLQSTCLNEAECEELYTLSMKLKHYFLRFPDLIDRELDNLGTQLFHIKDDRVRDLYISILCRSGGEPVISFLRQVYESHGELRETIIREYAGNEAAVDFLFEKHHAGEEGDDKGLTEPLIASLLQSVRGVEYFFERFFYLDQEEQLAVIDYLPYGSDQNLGAFINMVFESEHFPLKEGLLSKVSDYYAFSAKEVLFDPEKEKEFFFMEEKYLDTVTHLFPVSATKMLLEKIVDDDLPINKTRKYLQKLSEIAPLGLTFNLQGGDFFTSLLTKIVFFNNADLNCLFLSLLRHFKTFDFETYKSLNNALGVFSTLKEKKVSIKEGDELRKARKNVNELFFEVREIAGQLKNLEELLHRRVLDFDLLEDFFNRNGLCIALNIGQVSALIRENLEGAELESSKEWFLFLHRFPLIAFTVKDAISRKAGEAEGGVKNAFGKLLGTLPEHPPRIVIRLTSNPTMAIMREQCLEIAPGVTVETESDRVDEGDILLCDPGTLKDFILKNTLPSQRLFLLLDNLSDFSSYKSYNPRPLLKPFSAYRIIKEILKELYT